MITNDNNQLKEKYIKIISATTVMLKSCSLAMCNTCDGKISKTCNQTIQQYDDDQGVMLVREHYMGGMEGEIF